MWLETCKSQEDHGGSRSIRKASKAAERSPKACYECDRSPRDRGKAASHCFQATLLGLHQKRGGGREHSEV